MFDNTNLPSWEILRFRPALAHNPRFEAALRRAGRAIDLVSARLVPARPADQAARARRRAGGGIHVLVGRAALGGAEEAEKRGIRPAADSSARAGPRGPPRHAPGMAHGALTADRIILSAEGRLMIREHMVGSALESLELPSARLWSEFGMLAPPTATVAATLDERCDVAQLALIAVSLMAGRRIGLEEYPDALRACWTRSRGDTTGQDRCGSASSSLARTRTAARQRAIRSGAGRRSRACGAAGRARTRAGTMRQETLPTVPKEVPAKEDSTPPMWSAARRLPAPLDALLSRPPVPAAAVIVSRACGAAFRERVIRWATVAMCVVALAEAVVIARLLLARSTAAGHRRCQGGYSAAARGDPADRAAARRRRRSSSRPQRSIRTLPEIRAVVPPAAPVRTGAFRVSAPIELHVLDGERVSARASMVRSSPPPAGVSSSSSTVRSGIACVRWWTSRRDRSPRSSSRCRMAP